ncbi:MAG TPA: Hsp20/alpha crystallin family protein [Burkholderiales bacterium]|nr:Hsp20/alpha crystallin family protein [Burkholderiales bacterium]
MTYRDPRSWVWAEALELLRGAEKLQRRFFQIGAAEAPGWEPPVDLYETADGLTLCVALPGVAAEELEVSLEAGTVVVRGERAFPAAYQRAIIYRLEIPYGRFERRIALPAGRYQLIDRRLENGCVTLDLRRLG